MGEKSGKFSGSLHSDSLQLVIIFQIAQTGHVHF